MPSYSFSLLKQKRIPPHSKNKGATLYELMVVISIVAIVAVFTVPSLAKFLAKSRVSSTADQLYSDLQFAKAESLSRSTQIAVISQEGGWEKGWCVAKDFKNGQTCKDIAATNILLNKVGAEAKVAAANVCAAPTVLVPQLVFWNGYAFEQNPIFDNDPILAADRTKVPEIVPPVTLRFTVSSGSDSTLAQRWLLVKPSSLLVGNASETESQTLNCP